MSTTKNIKTDKSLELTDEQLQALLQKKEKFTEVELKKLNLKINKLTIERSLALRQKHISSAVLINCQIERIRNSIELNLKEFGTKVALSEPINPLDRINAKKRKHAETYFDLFKSIKGLNDKYVDVIYNRSTMLLPRFWQKTQALMKQQKDKKSMQGVLETAKAVADKFNNTVLNQMKEEKTTENES